MTIQSVFKLPFLPIIGMALISMNSYSQNLNVWYEKPAACWEETLPLGNGLIGMMPDGQILEENIVLNEISMWSGSPQDPNNDQAYQFVPEIQKMLFAGKNDLAEKLVNQNFICKGAGSGYGQGKNIPYGCFQNFAHLRFNHNIPGTISEYKRSLNLKDATASTTFLANNIRYKREYFTSLNKNIGVIRLSANKKRALNFAVSVFREEPPAQFTISDNELNWDGYLTDGVGGKGLQYAGKVKVILKGGEKLVEGNQITVKNADEAFIYFTASTSYYGHNPVHVVDKILDSVESFEFNKIRKLHVEEYSQVFNRVSLKINNEENQDRIPTDVRLRNFYENPGQDNMMAVLYYQFGRYLSISSSAPNVPNALPPNLQGLWAHQIQTPWNGDYHLNVNAQMNHWGVEVNNLSEYHTPFIELIKRIAQQGTKTAKAYYNSPGWVVYMMTNIWGYSAPGEEASWGASTASGWLCNHLWEHYRFTKDKEYLKEIYPFLKGAAEFYHATLVKDPKTGWLVTAPSVSPENAFLFQEGKAVSVVMGPTIDNQIVRELYEAVIQSNKELNLNDPFSNMLSNQLDSIPPVATISTSGRIMEWLEDYPEVEPQHRHVSHLYGLYPASFISPISTPEWAMAARKTLEVRGDEGTGWSRAWKILFWARLHDGDHALEILRQLLKPAFSEGGQNQKAVAGTYPNLFCAHPPFQIDGNFGGSAGIAEMLIQSHDGYIHLLPALPRIWHTGEVKGLKARGNFTVDIKWENGKVINYKIDGSKGDEVSVVVNGKKIEKKIE